MPRVTNTKKPIETKKNQKVAKKSNVKADKIILYTVLGVLLLGLGALTYWVVDTYILKESEPNYARFESLKDLHITLDEYKWLVGDNEEDSLGTVNYNVYVYIYNGNFKECTVCESMESAVIAAANAAAEKGYSFYVMDYNSKDTDGLPNYITNLLLPNRPALIHIEGEALASENAITTSPNSILSILNQIRY